MRVAAGAKGRSLNQKEAFNSTDIGARRRRWTWACHRHSFDLGFAWQNLAEFGNRPAPFATFRTESVNVDLTPATYEIL